MIRAIIFDLDNTLTDFMRMKEAAIEAGIDGMLDAGLVLAKDEIRRRIWEVYRQEGIEYQQVFDRVLDVEGVIDPKILAAGIVAYRRARASTLVLYPHVQYTLLELVKRGLSLAVVSDAPRAQAWLRLASLQLHNLFDHVVTFEDTGKRKPSPEPFQKALDLLGVGPGEALMVGDWAERDMVGASQLGIRTVFARYGDTFGTQESGADFELADIMDLLGIVDRLNEGTKVTGR
ncbi:MAG TPA: HAD-IA family hydrolase [Candidatus Eisenbacteria bacterium]|nr:HAD-IA family hydrolase [Candidatus Eisenbacteria bacterium]